MLGPIPMTDPGDEKVIQVKELKNRRSRIVANTKKKRDNELSAKRANRAFIVTQWLDFCSSLEYLVRITTQ